MMNLKKAKFKWKYIIVALAMIVGGVTMLFNNCAPNMFTANRYVGDVSASSLNGGMFDKVDSPVVVFTSNQQFQSMLNVTGQADAMTGTEKSEYDLRAASLAGESNVVGINAPMMVGTTSLAGEVCNGLLTKEKALAPAMRKFFAGVDFTKAVSGNSPDAYSASAEAMAQAFYNRDLTQDEQQILTGFYTQFIKDLPAANAAQAAQTSNLYLSLCSAMLSSFDSMTY
jgi:hypothetical protein